MDRPLGSAAWACAFLNTARTMADAETAEGKFCAVARGIGAVCGFRLFTVLRCTERRGFLERVFSDDRERYPLGAVKDLSASPLTKVVIDERRDWLGKSADDIRWAFPDHEAILALGLGAAMNIPVTFRDSVLGCMNCLDTAGAYGEAHLRDAKPFAALLIPALLSVSEGVSDRAGC